MSGIWIAIVKKITLSSTLLRVRHRAPIAMGCSQAKPKGAADEIGRLAIKGTGCCGDSPPYSIAEPGFCEPATAPKGPEYDAAKSGLAPILGKVHGLVEEVIKKNGCCGGYAGALDQAKAALTEKGWLAEVNTHLAQHTLISDLEAFWIYNGQSSTQHLHLRLFKTDGESGKALLSGEPIGATAPEEDAPAPEEAA